MIKKRIEPKKGQESVWDYPRPPRMEDCLSTIRIIFSNEIIAETKSAKRILETSHPPVYYIPPEDIKMEYLIPASGKSWCEWKGVARYYSIKARDEAVEKAAWYYPEPTMPFISLKNYVAFYAGPMDACFVNGEKVAPQPGGFYGGWITKNIVGPFKGDLGTMFW
jgi:uncharacterized protein (DUF427 family)